MNIDNLIDFLENIDEEIKPYVNKYNELVEKYKYKDKYVLSPIMNSYDRLYIEDDSFVFERDEYARGCHMGTETSYLPIACLKDGWFKEKEENFKSLYKKEVEDSLLKEKASKANQEKALKDQEEKERLEYERLKEKFEN